VSRATDHLLRLGGLTNLSTNQAEEALAFARAHKNHLRAELMDKEVFTPKNTPSRARVLQLLDERAPYQVVVDGEWACTDCKGKVFWIDLKTRATWCESCSPPAPGEAAQWVQVWPELES